MGLFGKLKDILFDEETVEIPIITKDEEENGLSKKKPQKKDEDEVVIHKIESTKKEEEDNDDLFDMPKLKEEVKVEEKKNNFTFPVFEDDDKDIVTKRRSDKKERETEVNKREKKASGFTNAYDYSYGKYKGDYKSSRLANQDVLVKSLEIKEERKAFTPSPIISPVYGILNENYKKEDIVAKEEQSAPRNSSNSLDLDVVRRKAYGTLEDEIELSLGNDDDFISPMAEKKEEVEVEVLKEDGISISDLLVDNDDEAMSGEIMDEPEIEDEHELFDILDEGMSDVQEEIDIDEEEPVSIEKEVKEVPSEEIEEPIEKIDEEQTEPKEETPDVEVPDEQDENEEEDDLFDLIDSIYERKDEE